MNTTLSEPTRCSCPRCGGRGKIAAYSHIKAGECYGCHGTGGIYKLVERPMTDEEVTAALASVGVVLMEQTTAKPAIDTGAPEDWFFSMMETPEEQELRRLAMIGARLLLAAI